MEDARWRKHRRSFLGWSEPHLSHWDGTSAHRTFDHRAIADVVAGRSVGLHGVVFDPLYEDRHSELRHLIVDRNLDAVLVYCLK